MVLLVATGEILEPLVITKKFELVQEDYSNNFSAR